MTHTRNPSAQVIATALIVVTLRCANTALAADTTPAASTPSLASSAATSATAPAASGIAGNATAKPEASIAFVNHGGLRNFDAESDDGMYFESSNGRWYYGKFFSPCIGIQFAESIAVLTGTGADTLDRWSRIQSRQAGTCHLTSLTESDGPPSRKKHALTPAKAASATAPATTSSAASPAVDKAEATAAQQH